MPEVDRRAKRGTISHLKILLALHMNYRQSGCVPDGQSGRAQKSDVAFFASFRRGCAARCMYRYINATNASQEGGGAFRNRRAVSYRWRGKRRTTGYSMSVPSVLTRYWDIFDSIDFTCSGSMTWESPRMAAPTGDGEASTTTTPRENGASAGGGTPSPDGTAMPQWRGRGGGAAAGSHDTDAAAVDGRIVLVV
jgi:hypothetical protein